MTADVAFSPALHLAARMRAGELSPVEALDAYLQRIDELDGALGAYVTVAHDQAREQATLSASRIARGEARPFEGVPLAVKDLNETAGLRTTHGSRRFADHVPQADDACVRRLRAAGFVVLGKTTVPEFGWSPVSEPPDFPPARNPWNLEFSPGGSSGGSAAAVAAGLAPVAQGSDAGGSIRTPSAHCGLFGLKPSRGRVSQAPEPARLLWQNGPIARTVADAAAVLDVLAGPEPGDAWSAPPPARPFAEEVGRPPGALRVALSFGGGEVDAPRRKAVEETAGLLEELGHHVVGADPAPDWAAPPDTATVEAAAGYTGVQVSQYPGLGPFDALDLEGMDPVNRLLLSAAAEVRAVDYVALDDMLLRACRDIAAFFETVDVLCSPVVPHAVRLGAGREDGALATLVEWVRLGAYTYPWNLTGQPAVSVPAGFDDHGVPIGVQLVGRPAGEATLIRLSAQLEEARPWSMLRPELP